VYLSSLELKCIMPCDLKDCSEVEGFYKIQRSTLQIGEEDHLQKGDILYNINGEQLAYKNRFDIISKLSSLGGIAEISVMRKASSSCFGCSSNEEVPYHNGIFAQNSIKLAMRKYDQPSALKSNSEVELGLSSSHNSKSNNSNFTKPICKSKSEQIQQTDQFLKDYPQNVANNRSELIDDWTKFEVELGKYYCIIIDNKHYLNFTSNARCARFLVVNVLNS
jgi:hypothetical protein